MGDQLGHPQSVQVKAPNSRLSFPSLHWTGKFNILMTLDSISPSIARSAVLRVGVWGGAGEAKSYSYIHPTRAGDFPTVVV